MIDHMTVTVRDYARSKAFYAQALRPLGYSEVMEFGEMCGFGPDRKPYFWLKRGDPPTQPMHIAFAAGDRSAVDAFHAAALAAGGRDNGAPGLRLDYHPSYYAAFAFDPNDHNIEVVCHRPPGPARKKPSRKAAGSSRTSRRRAPRAAVRGRRSGAKRR